MPYVIKNPSARKELTFWPCSQARNPGGLRLRRAISLIDGFTWFGGGVVLTTSLKISRTFVFGRFTNISLKTKVREIFKRYQVSLFGTRFWFFALPGMPHVRAELQHLLSHHARCTRNRHLFYHMVPSTTPERTAAALEKSAAVPPGMVWHGMDLTRWDPRLSPETSATNEMWLNPCIRVRIRGVFGTQHRTAG